MPGGDRTGPRGKGPRTGGGFGDCPPNNSTQSATRQNTEIPVRSTFGRGLGPCGRGLARGFRGGRGRGNGRGRW